MIATLRASALSLCAAVVIVGCGGGGGSGGSGSTTVGGGGPQSVAVTSANAKPVAANALDAAQNTSATRGAAGLPVGVQVDAATALPDLLLFASAARHAIASFAAAKLPVGITVSETDACTLGGTVTITGTVASAAGLSPGDSLTAVENNCVEPVGTTTVVTNGQLSMTIVSGQISTLPFHVVMDVTATNLSVLAGAVTVVANGDVRLDWSGSSATSQTLVATGTSMASRETVNGVSHTSTIRNYAQTITINGSVVSGSLAATVETDSSRVAATAVTYTIATPTSVTWNASTRLATAGVVQVTGANNSKLLLTINADGTATIQVDANGDGAYESTITTDTAELAGLV